MLKPGEVYRDGSRTNYILVVSQQPQSDYCEIITVYLRPHILKWKTVEQLFTEDFIRNYYPFKAEPEEFLEHYKTAISKQIEKINELL